MAEYARGVGSIAMKILYKPFAIIGSILSARLGRNLFRSLWSTIDDGEPPDATAADATLPKVIGAAALEAATMAAVAAAVSRSTARAFHYLTGYWPEDKKDKDEESQD
jgi:glutamine synthetase type III